MGGGDNSENKKHNQRCMYIKYNFHCKRKLVDEECLPHDDNFIHELSCHQQLPWNENAIIYINVYLKFY